MKKYIYSFAVCAALFCTSCDESRLNIEQKAVSSTENFYKTDQDAVDAMTAAYAQFLDNVCSSAGIYQPQFTLLNYSADDVFSAGTNYADHMDMRVFDEFRYDTGNAPLKELYQRYYKSIYASNLVITYVDPAASTVMARCVAEARVLRAYCHMMAALTFQRPPKVDKLLGADDKPTNVESQKSLLEWCASECEEAVNDLDSRKGPNDVEGAFKVTKGFAYFVAGKSAVFADDMARAEKNLKPLVESPNYALVPGNRFRDLFHVEGNGCEEKIFEANCFGNIDKGFWSNIQRGRWMTNNVLNWRYDRLGSRASICGANDGWGGGAINWKFAEKMYQNDGDGPRRKATFLTPDEFLYDSKLCGWETDFDADGNEMSLADKKKDPKRTVEFLSETTQVKESSESTVSDNTLAEGQKVLESYGHTGYSARLWKIVKINGKQVSKKVFNTSTYMSTPTVYRVGTKKAEDKKDDKKDKKKDSKETTAQKSETTTAAHKSTTAAQKSTTAKRSAAVKSQGSTGN